MIRITGNSKGVSGVIFFMVLLTAMMISPSHVLVADVDSGIDSPARKISPLFSPVRIAFGNRDMIYVSDYHKKRILVQRLKNFNLNLKAEIKIAGNPLGVAVFNDKFIFVGNSSKNIVQVYRENGKYAYKFPVKARRPNDIAVSKRKNVYVVASDENLVKVYSFYGKFQFAFGGKGTGDGEFNFPTGIAIDEINRELIISDFMNKRIQVFDMDGNWLRTFGGGMFMSVVDRPQGISIDKAGNYHIVDSQQACVHVFNNQGTRIRSYGEYGRHSGQVRTPLDIVLDRNGNAFVTSYLNKSVVIFKGAAK